MWCSVLWTSLIFQLLKCSQSFTKEPCLRPVLVKTLNSFSILSVMIRSFNVPPSLPLIAGLICFYSENSRPLFCSLFPVKHVTDMPFWLFPSLCISTMDGVRTVLCLQTKCYQMRLHCVIPQTRKFSSLPWLFIILPWNTEESWPLCQISSKQGLISLIHIAHHGIIRENKYRTTERCSQKMKYVLLREKRNSELLTFLISVQNFSGFHVT